MFRSPTDKNEIPNINALLDSIKLVEPNDIATKISKLSKNDNSCQLYDICNISFSTGVFPSILKIAKVVLFHKKISRLDFSNYCPTLLL